MQICDLFNGGLDQRNKTRKTANRTHGKWFSAIREAHNFRETLTDLRGINENRGLSEK